MSLQGRAETILVPGDQIDRKEKSTFSLILWETPCLPLTQGQGRPWRGQSSHAASPGPHSQLMAAACSPCHAQSPPGSEGEGAAEPQTSIPSSSWPRSGLGPGTHLVLTECVEGTDLQDIERTFHLMGSEWVGCSAPGKGPSLVLKGVCQASPLHPQSLTYLGWDFKGKKVETPGSQGLQSRTLTA